MRRLRLRNWCWGVRLRRLMLLPGSGSLASGGRCCASGRACCQASCCGPVRLRLALTLGGGAYRPDRIDRPAGYPFPVVPLAALLRVAVVARCQRCRGDGAHCGPRVVPSVHSGRPGPAGRPGRLPLRLFFGGLLRRRSEPTPIATAPARRAAIGRRGGRSVHGLPRLERLSVVFALPWIGTARNSPASLRNSSSAQAIPATSSKADKSHVPASIGADAASAACHPGSSHRTN